MPATERSAGTPFTLAVHQLLTENESPLRQALAIGLGVFIGATPLYGLHLALCLLAGSLFGLNRVKLYIAANISNPLFAPFLVFLEIQAGSFLLTGGPEPLRLKGLRLTDAWMFAQELVVGSLLVGLLLGLAAGLATWFILSHTALADDDRELVDKAARRYLVGGLPAWEFASAKLRHDPVYLALLKHDCLPGSGTIVDLGCGQGLFFALMLAARPGRGPLLGIDARERRLALARKALGEAARFERADLTLAELPAARAVLLLDVLHYLPTDAQERLLGRIFQALEPGGVLFLREADAAPSLGFLFVRMSERLRALLRGDFHQRFHFRSSAGWLAGLAHAGFQVEQSDMSTGTPFANRLFTARRPS